MPCEGLKHSLLFISLLNTHKMNSIAQVYLGVDGDSLQQFKNRRRQRQWVAIFYRYVIKATEIYTWS